MNVLESAGSAMAVPAAGNSRPERRYKTRRSCPVDFGQVAPGQTDTWLLHHYGTSRPVVIRWRGERGIPETPPPLRGKGIMREAPADLREMAAKKHKKALMAHYAMSWSVLDRLLKEGNIVPIAAPPPRSAVRDQMPHDFVTRAPHMTLAQMSRQFRLPESTVSRLVAATGVKPAKHARPRASFLSQSIASAPAPSDGTMESAAATFLRPRYAVWPYKVKPLAERKHLPDQGNALWFLLGRAVTGAELVEFARSKGFDPRAWARL